MRLRAHRRFEPIEDNRGPGRRTCVFVEGIPDSLIASRPETAILSDIVEGAGEPGPVEVQRRLLVELLETLEGLDPVLRRVVSDQARWDVDRLESTIRSVLGLGEKG